MRTKSSKTLYFDFSGESSITVAKEYRAKYEAISQILDANRQVLRLAHRDGAQLLSTSAKGRDGYTSEQLLRALIVMFMEGVWTPRFMRPIFITQRIYPCCGTVSAPCHGCCVRFRKNYQNGTYVIVSMTKRSKSSLRLFPATPPVRASGPCERSKVPIGS